ncbi:hypothetical protein HMPREF0454_00172 [Hafnia alvei ATCC 51873]|uniref:Uncharacterized protein n=1 Tax=Hafnia alvei ATCC 51873 TaxID=1002364 RepID=G9Y0W4_HAFAL|nr:hypothetical protein HMPREF0454_00172 [Hafnia alvei ATCC 51873]
MTTKLYPNGLQPLTNYGGKQREHLSFGQKLASIITIEET